MEHLAGQYFLNSDLRADEIRTQIMELHNAGYETIFLHARAGLKTPYLSQDWFDALRVAVDELICCGMKFAKLTPSIWAASSIVINLGTTTGSSSPLAAMCFN